MSASSMIGAAVWLKGKADELEDLYEVYEMTRSNAAMLDIVAKVGEITAGLAAGIAAEGLLKAFQQSGLDRVFASIRADVPLETYMKNQAASRAIIGYAAGEATDGLIGALNSYMSENGTLDPVFAMLEYMLEETEDPNDRTYGERLPDGSWQTTYYDQWGNADSVTVTGPPDDWNTIAYTEFSVVYHPGTGSGKEFVWSHYNTYGYLLFEIVEDGYRMAPAAIPSDEPLSPVVVVDATDASLDGEAVLGSEQGMGAEQTSDDYWANLLHRESVQTQGVATGFNSQENSVGAFISVEQLMATRMIQAMSNSMLPTAVGGASQLVNIHHQRIDIAAAVA